MIRSRPDVRPGVRRPPRFTVVAEAFREAKSLAIAFNIPIAVRQAVVAQAVEALLRGEQVDEAWMTKLARELLEQ
jgi:hypothetical protein